MNCDHMQDEPDDAAETTLRSNYPREGDAPRAAAVVDPNTWEEELPFPTAADWRAAWEAAA